MPPVIAPDEPSGTSELEEAEGGKDEPGSSIDATPLSPTFLPFLAPVAAVVPVAPLAGAQRTPAPSGDGGAPATVAVTGATAAEGVGATKPIAAAPAPKIEAQAQASTAPPAMPVVNLPARAEIIARDVTPSGALPPSGPQSDASGAALLATSTTPPPAMPVIPLPAPADVASLSQATPASTPVPSSPQPSARTAPATGSANGAAPLLAAAPGTSVVTRDPAPTTALLEARGASGTGRKIAIAADGADTDTSLSGFAATLFGVGGGNAAPIVPGAQQPTPADTLDTRDPAWLAGLAERIAEAGARTGHASIRLTPDALGAISVSVRKLASGLAVSLHAEDPHAHEMLLAAQPQLSALAQARGVHIDSTTVTGGDTAARAGTAAFFGGERQGQSGDRASRSAPPPRTPTALADRDDAVEPSNRDRIA